MHERAILLLLCLLLTYAYLCTPYYFIVVAIDMYDQPTDQPQIDIGPLFRLSLRPFSIFLHYSYF